MAPIDRRGFSAGMAAAGLLTALGQRRVAGANERIGLGIIGCGGKGQALWKNFLSQTSVDPVAICDVYQPFSDKGQALAAGRARLYRDFRQLLDDRDVQAVIIATPDHWHALQTIAACRAGKDVYVEKPLSLFVREGRSMVAAARKHGRVVQTGSQQRSGEHYRQAIELIRAGEIGPVHHVTVTHARNVLPGLRPRDLAIDDRNLDWELWLGPAPRVAFDPFRCIYNFRWFWDYSGGQLTNFGAHHLDIVRWALGARGPSAVAGFGGRFAVKDGGETPDVQQVIYQFPDCVVTWSSREMNQGGRSRFDIEFHGTKGTLGINRREFSLMPDGAASSGEGDSGSTAAPTNTRQVKGGALDQPHIANFLECIKSRARPNADVEDGHLSATMCHLGNIATRLGRSLRWDADKESFLGDPAANRQLTRAYRKPWSLAAV